MSEREREKKQLKVINYEIIPWQRDVRSNYCFQFFLHKSLKGFGSGVARSCNGISRSSTRIVYATMAHKSTAAFSLQICSPKKTNLLAAVFIRMHTALVTFSFDPAERLVETFNSFARK